MPHHSLPRSHYKSGLWATGSPKACADSHCWCRKVTQGAQSSIGMATAPGHLKSCEASTFSHQQLTLFWQDNYKMLTSTEPKPLASEALFFDQSLWEARCCTIFSLKVPGNSCREEGNLRQGFQCPNVLCLSELCPTLGPTAVPTSLRGVGTKKPLVLF